MDFRTGGLAQAPRPGGWRSQRLHEGRRGLAREYRSDRDGQKHVRRQGPWGADPWDGWWGENPPFHTPVFIVTHHARQPVAKGGGTTFTFVTDGIESALEQARAAGGGKDVALGGGASVAQQYLAAGLIDEMKIHLVPVLLGDGARLFDNLGPAKIGLECTRVVEAPGVTHLTYRIVE